MPPSARGTRSGQPKKQVPELAGFVGRKRRNRVGRDLDCGIHSCGEQRRSRFGQADGQSAPVGRIGHGRNQPQFHQPVDHALDRGGVHCRRPAQMVLRNRADFRQPGQDGKLSGRDLGDRSGEDGQMPLRHPTQDIADLVIETVLFRITHGIAIRLVVDPCKAVDRIPGGFQSCCYTNEFGVFVPDYSRPQTLSEALRLKAEGGWRVLAGGTDIYPGVGASLPGQTLDLGAVAELSGIRSEKGLRIGAATTWAAIAQSALPPALRGLQQAARQVGGRQVQNAGTIGGNLCNASPAADGVPPLLTLDAEVELVSHSGRRVLPLSRFLIGPRRTALAEDEVLKAVLIPERALRGKSAFVKLGARTHLVISIAMVAARIEVKDGHVVGAALAVGSCGPVATRLTAVEAALVGLHLAEAVERIAASDVGVALAPIDDVRASASYRLEAAVELVRRAVAEALA